MPLSWVPYLATRPIDKSMLQKYAILDYLDLQWQWILLVFGLCIGISLQEEHITIKTTVKNDIFKVSIPILNQVNIWKQRNMIHFIANDFARLFSVWHDENLSCF